MAPEELGLLISKVRRGTNNRDILLLCDELASRLTHQVLKTPADRREYMRVYMRDVYRPKQKLKRLRLKHLMQS